MHPQGAGIVQQAQQQRAFGSLVQLRCSRAQFGAAASSSATTSSCLSELWRKSTVAR